jgi:hypothetical protein
VPSPSRTPRAGASIPAVLLVVLVALLGLAGCGEEEAGPVTTDAPADGACRVLDAEDVALPSNDTPAVDCTEPHTAETFEVDELPADLQDLDPDAREIGAFVYTSCSRSFQRFLEADDSAVMRTVVSWAWFRPSDEAWDAGARWYRCDVVGGGEQLTDYRDLPETAKGLLEGMPPDEWMVCATGRTVDGSPKVPCSEPHTWRAVTTIKVGEADEEYPGDRIVEVTTRDYCSDSVGAWLGYPASYDFGYTFFRQAEWEAGNRRSVCWAQTQQ